MLLALRTLHLEQVRKVPLILYYVLVLLSYVPVLLYYVPVLLYYVPVLLYLPNKISSSAILLAFQTSADYVHVVRLLRATLTSSLRS